MGGIVGRGTLAFITSSVVSPGHTFSLGVVDITASSLPTTTAFGWTTTAAGSNCSNVFSGGTSTYDLTQAMTPGMYCVAPLTISNANANSDDAWMRIRLVRATGSTSAANEALNDRLKFYMSEYTAASEANALAIQGSDCNTSNFKPTWSASVGGTGAGPFADVFGTSIARIADKSFTSPAIGNRTAVTSLSDPTNTGIGRNIGAHPGMSAVTPKSTNTASSGIASNAGNVSTNAYGAGQASDVLALVNATDEDTAASASFTTFSGTSAVDYVPASKNGLRLFAGTDPTAAAPTEANMVTATTATVSTRNSFNVVGNDEVTNPVKTGPAANGTEPHGSNAEAQILKGTTRYYCVAVFFPSDTDKSFSTVYAASALGSGTVLQRYFPTGSRLQVTSPLGLQWRDCTTAAGIADTTNCTRLANDAINAANGKGDDAAALGSLTYYLTITAAQKAGRTTA